MTDDLRRRAKRAPRARRHSPLDCRHRKLDAYMSVGQCRQKGATTKPDQFKAWLENQEQEQEAGGRGARGLVPGSISVLEGRAQQRAAVLCALCYKARCRAYAPQRPAGDVCLAMAS